MTTATAHPSATPAAPPAKPAPSITLLAALSYPARQWHGADGVGLVELVVRDLNRTFVESIRCTWRGHQAMQFWSAFGPQLRAGRPLHLGVQHIRATHDGQMTARVTSCSLAPLSHSMQKHLQQQTTGTPAPVGTHHQPSHHQGAST